MKAFSFNEIGLILISNNLLFPWCYFDYPALPLLYFLYVFSNCFINMFYVLYAPPYPLSIELLNLFLWFINPYLCWHYFFQWFSIAPLSLYAFSIPLFLHYKCSSVGSRFILMMTQIWVKTFIVCLLSPFMS